jgi:hypothetical protein
MRTFFIVLSAVALAFWLSQLTFVLPGVGIIALGWPIAVIIVALLYSIVGGTVWLVRRARG